MRTTLYSHRLRLAVCAHCGAPLEVQIGGGTAKCSYCAHVNQIVRRDESGDLAEARQSQQDPMSESARMDTLRAQDNRPLPVPPDVAQLLAGGKLAPPMRQHAIQEWLATRNRVLVAAPFTEQERLFHLTLVIAPALEDRHQRALLEDAVETLPDARHRQVLRCRLAVRAVLAQDLDAAREWLEPCNPRPTDLVMDTAYRIAACYLAIAQGNPAGVLSLLGNRPGDVPIADAHDAEADVLRAHAIEQSGHPHGAVDHLLFAMRRDLRNVTLIRELAAGAQPLAICPASLPAALQQIWQQIEQQVRPTSATSIGCLLLIALLPVGGLTLIGAVLAGVFGYDDAVVINLVLHPLIWLVIVPGIVLAIALAGRRRRLRLRDHGVLTIAHVTSCERRVLRGKSSTTVLQEVELAIELGGSYVRSHQSITRDEAIPLGPYPCLVDPSHVGNLVLKIQPLL